MESRSIVLLSAGLSQPSSTRLLGDRLAEAAARRLADDGIRADVTVIELRDLATDVTNQLLTGFPSPRLAEAHAALAGADGLIAVTPIFTTSYSGLFKSFVDVIDPDALVGLPVLIGATGGTERHSLALDYAIRPLFAYLKTVVTPTGVYAASGDWGTGATESSGAGAGSLPDRIERAGIEFAALVRGVAETRRVRDPFALPAGFDPSGGTRSL